MDEEGSDRFIGLDRLKQFFFVFARKADIPELFVAGNVSQ